MRIVKLRDISELKTGPLEHSLEQVSMLQKEYR